MRCNKLVNVALRLARCAGSLRATTGAVVAAGAILMIAGQAQAFLDTGTLLTNSASAVYEAPAGTNNSVSYSATAKILVANPAVYLWKEATPTQVTASAGGLVTFKICFSNGGANTAFKLTITDKLPNNTYWWNSHTSWYTNLSGSAVTTMQPYYSPTSVNGPWYNPVPMGLGQPLFMQWVVPEMGVGMSGCITFTVSVG